MTRGVRQIVRFNWPFYAVAAAALALAPAAIARLTLPSGARLVLYAGTALAALWVVTSLIASWLIYDRSPLMRWDWLPRALGFQPGAWINIHSGLDESTPAIRALFGAARGRVFDMFDPGEMTEHSIVRARHEAHNMVTPEHVDYHRLPIPTGTVEAALLLLSAHELRTDAARLALFTELRTMSLVRRLFPTHSHKPPPPWRGASKSKSKSVRKLLTQQLKTVLPLTRSKPSCP